MIIEDDNDQLMAMSAVDYCLGRQTYMVGVAEEWIQAHWDQFSGNTQYCMLRDICHALDRGNAGDKRIDAPIWQGLANWMAQQMREEDHYTLDNVYGWYSGPTARELFSDLWPEQYISGL
jgi:hypothetical protein